MNNENSENTIKERIKMICVDLFGIDDIQYDDDFFELGVNSLLATQLLYRLKREFEIDISLEVILATPSIDGIGDVLMKQLSGANAERVSGNAMEQNKANQEPDWENLEESELLEKVQTLSGNEVESLLKKLKASE